MIENWATVLIDAFLDRAEYLREKRDRFSNGQKEYERLQLRSEPMTDIAEALASTDWSEKGTK